MSRYIPLTERDKEEMLKEIGVSSIDELFSSIPPELRFKGTIDIEPIKEEAFLVEYFKKIEAQNRFSDKKIFLGAGAYNHYIPYAVDFLSMRSEYLTPYTPYQPEVSQGNLAATFEYQTYIAALTGLEVANASMYEGATATAEAGLMALRIKKGKIALAKSLHPQYKEVIYTYLEKQNYEIIEIGYEEDGRINLEELDEKIDNTFSAFIVGYPNFFGIVEDLKSIHEILREKKVLLITSTWEPLALALIVPPGKTGAEIAVGEAQSFGLPLAYGGPYLGFFATLKKHVWKMPGRLVGMTKDVEGKRGFVLTLSAREQHIRRQRATSNICSNEAWCALRVAIYLSLLGRKGLRKLALLNHKRAVKALEMLEEKGFKAKFTGPFFNEFVIDVGQDGEEFRDKLLNRGLVAGYPIGKDYPKLKNCLLLTFTEMNSPEDIGTLVKEMEALK